MNVTRIGSSIRVTCDRCRAAVSLTSGPAWAWAGLGMLVGLVVGGSLGVVGGL